MTTLCPVLPRLFNEPEHLDLSLCSSRPCPMTHQSRAIGAIAAVLLHSDLSLFCLLRSTWPSAESDNSIQIGLVVNKGALQAARP